MIQSITESYEAHLLDHYPAGIIDQITDTDNWQHAPVPGMPGETVPYVHVRPQGSEEPADNPQLYFYIPGFVEGPAHKASTVAELVNRGHEVVIPGQNRAVIDKDNRPPDMTAAMLQADNYLSVMNHAGIAESSPTIIGRSYGGLVFDSMSQLARSRDGHNPFKDSTVFLVASAGLIDGESKLRFLGGYLRMVASERNMGQQTFPDVGGFTAKISQQAMAANKLRAWQEVREMTETRIDPELPFHVGRLVVVSHAQDHLFPADRQSSRVGRMVENGATWFTPVSLGTGNSDDLPGDRFAPLRGGDGATHDDEQLNPARLAGALDYYLDNS